MSTTFSRVISTIFSPVTIPSFIALLIIWLNPYIFDHRLRFFFLGIIIIWSFLIPVVGLALMKKLDFVNNLALSENKERIIPYFLFIFCFTIIFYVINNLQIPEVVKAVFVGFLISVCFSFFLNNFLNISAHANAMGNLLGACLTLLTIATRSIDTLIILVILLCGLVLSARLRLEKHNLREVFTGFFLGLASQFIAFIAFGIFS